MSSSVSEMLLLRGNGRDLRNRGHCPNDNMIINLLIAEVMIPLRMSSPLRGPVRFFKLEADES